MPKKTLRALSKRAIARGLDPLTPAVAVTNATRHDEIVVASTISSICDMTDAEPGNGPMLVLIGRALAQTAGSTHENNVPVLGAAAI